jgi:hypothetical protein
MPYDLFEHRHRFSSWAAARAAQRGWKNASIKNLRDAIENCGIVTFLRNDDAMFIDKEGFKKHHKIWCRLIVDFLNSRGLSNVTYGRAAKLVGVYIKSMVIIGPDSNSSLAVVAHPPIDRILLRNLSNAPEIENHLRERCRLINFTELDEQSYYDLISQLRRSLGDDEPFWSLERFCTVTND